ncbi:MAG: FtsX-like permease family protein [Acidimicrobiales bacterium]
MGRGGLLGRGEGDLAWYRFRAAFRHRWSGYLGIVLLVGLIGGLAMGSVAAARRTASSFAVFWASTNPSDLVGATAVLNPGLGPGSGYNPVLVKAISRLPHVAQVESQSGIDFLPLQKDGRPLVAPNFYAPAAGNGYGSVDGMYFDQDKVTVVQGHMANPNRSDELMLSPSGASALGVHVGSVLPVGIYTNAETELPAFGTAKLKPNRVIDEHVVGIVEFSNGVIEDQVDASSVPNNLFTPALTQKLLRCCVNYTETGVRVSGGAHNLAAVQSELTALLPKGFPTFSRAETSVVDKAQRSIKPEALALGVFGTIVALAALLIAGQVTSRQLRLGADEREVLRALGAGSVTTSSDGLIGIGTAIVLGALLAAGVAVALSPLAPLGPVRPVYPYPGISFDWTVLGFGVLCLVVILGAIAGVVSYKQAPHRSARRGHRVPERPSSIVSAAQAAGLPAPALTGARFALEAGSGRRSVPVRSAILGAAMAVIVVVATVTFGASLDSLVSHPSLYGWNWDYMLASGGDIPEHQVTGMLRHDHHIAEWSGVYSGLLRIDGENVPVLGESPGADVAPPLLSGHGVDTSSQVVLGAVTLAQLHKHLGDLVEVSNGTSTAALRVVGTAAMPTIGSSFGEHLEMGTGAVVSYSLIPAVERNPFNNPISGPNAILVRLRSGSRAAGLQSLNRIAAATSNTANFGVTVTGVLRPAEIVNYRSLGDIPVYLGAGLAAGAVAALALTLLASVRRRRRDLALLKTLGFTGPQLAAVVAWQSTIAVAIGAVVGVPLGIALGRWLWDLFARSIHAVPAPEVPVVSVALIALGALVLANVVAVVPGRLAARTPTALLLRSE